MFFSPKKGNVATPADRKSVAPANPEPAPAPHTVTEDGVTFLNQPSTFRQITDIREYQFDDITPDDYVVDIGANVGAFCIRASRYTGNVFAVEPLTAGILQENIQLNDACITVLEGALGDGNPTEICWDSRRAVVPSYSLRTITRLAGGCTFLKCDCEGAEWLIAPEDLADVRRIEMELHLPPISGPPNPALLDYISRNYLFGIERKPVHNTLGVMGILHAVRKGYAT
jgi:FkbM family methyltransferase